MKHMQSIYRLVLNSYNKYQGNYWRVLFSLLKSIQENSLVKNNYQNPLTNKWLEAMNNQWEYRIKHIQQFTGLLTFQILTFIDKGTTWAVKVIGWINEWTTQVPTRPPSGPSNNSLDKCYKKLALTYILIHKLFDIITNW